MGFAFKKCNTSDVVHSLEVRERKKVPGNHSGPVGGTDDGV